MKTLRLAVIALAFTSIQSWASTTTPRLGMTIPAYGDQNWDVQLRSNFNIIDSSVAASSNTAVLNGTNTFTGSNTFANTTITYGNALKLQSSVGTGFQSILNQNGLGAQSLELTAPDGIGIGTNNPYIIGTQGQPYLTVASAGGTWGTYGRFAVLGSSADSTVTYSGFTSTNSVNTSTLWVLPRNDGTANQPLATDGAANLSFASSLTLSSFTVTTSTSTRFNATVSSITTLATQNFTVNTATVSTSLAMNGKKITNIANGATSTDAAAFGQIKYLQAPVVCYSTTTYNATTTAYTATLFTCSITPTSASNKIKITVSGEGQTAVISNIESIAIFRGGTNVCAALGGATSCQSIRAPAANVYVAGASFTVQDSPATTSQVTYTLELSASDNTNIVQWNRDQDLSSIILEETP